MRQKFENHQISSIFFHLPQAEKEAAEQTYFLSTAHGPKGPIKQKVLSRAEKKQVLGFGCVAMSKEGCLKLLYFISDL